MASPEVLTAVLKTLADAYDKRLDDTRKTIYRSMLADLPDDLLMAAAKQVISNCRFFPSVAEIREAAADLSKQTYRVPSSAEAWSELVNKATRPSTVRVSCETAKRLDADYLHWTSVLGKLSGTKDECAWNAANTEFMKAFAEMRHHSFDDCPDCQQVTVEYKFSHPLIEQVARRLGWPDKFWSDEIGVDRGRFIKTYETEVARLTASATMLPEVRNYVENNTRQLSLDENQRVFDTGERNELMRQTRRLSHQMES